MDENYPENLIVENEWGSLPLLYAPSEVVQFLIDSYHFLYPNHELDWSEMVMKVERANAFQDVIKNLLDDQQTLSPGYIID